jgi:hypothetical protein
MFTMKRISYSLLRNNLLSMFIRIYFLCKSVYSEEILHHIIESLNPIGYSDCEKETAVTYQL